MVIIVDGTKYAVTFTIYPTGLANRVAQGEETQAQIQQTISDALEVQERTLKKDEVNRVTNAFRVSSDNKTFVSTANNELGLYNVADPTNPAHALNLGYADDRYLKSADSAFLPLSGGELTGDVSFLGQSNFNNSVNLRSENRINFIGPSDTNLVGYIKAVSDNEVTFSAYSSNKLNIKNLNDPTAATDAATRGYVDGVVAPFVTDADVQAAINSETVHLPLTGGTLSGQVTFNRIGNSTNGLVIKGKNSSGDDIDLLRVYHNNGSGAADAINYIGRQDADTNIVTNAYVTENYAAKNHAHNEYTKAALWKAVSPSTDANNLQVGEFFVADNNNLYLHFKSDNGIDLGISGSTEYSKIMTYLASVYGRGTYNSMYSTVADKINFNVGSNNYIRVQSSHLLYNRPWL